MAIAGIGLWRALLQRENAENRWAAFWASDSRHAPALVSEWRKTTEIASAAAGLATIPASLLEAGA